MKRINPWTGTDFSPRIYSVELPRISSPRRSFLVISLHHFVQLILLWFWIMGDFARFTTPSTRGRGNKKQRNDLWLASRSLFLAQHNDSVVEILLPFFSTEFDGEFFEKEKKKNEIENKIFGSQPFFARRKYINIS